MKIAFASSSTFGLPTLQALAGRGENLVCVITQPERPAGRGRRLALNPVKRFAMDNGLKVFQPSNINDASSVRKLRRFQPDLMLVIAYGQILSRKVLDIPKNGGINLHASLLPKYRGAAPINWALINGETDTGLSIIRMAERMDAGDLLAQQPVHITHTETAGQLHDRLARRGADLVVDVIHDITLGHVEDRPQDESRASYAPRLKKTFGRIAWDKPARELVNFIRGVTPWPTAFTFIKLRRGKPASRIVVDRATVAAGSVPKDAKNGHVLSADARGIHVSTGRGVLSITNLTPAGSRSMTAADFLNGYPLKVGDRFMETPS